MLEISKNYTSKRNKKMTKIRTSISTLKISTNSLLRSKRIADAVTNYE
jgi:hypothetical protein